MDPIVLVALIGVFTTVITTIGLVVTAIVNNRREKSDSAQKALERVHKERIEFKDEIIADLRSDLLEALRENKVYKHDEEERKKGKHGRDE